MVFEEIKERRSIRKYEDQDLPDDLVERVLDAARWAPSWANTQCWRFIVVRSKGTKEKLAESLTPRNPARDAVSEAPLVIVGCAKKKVSGYKKGDPVTKKGDWYMFDSGLAMQNLMLAAHSLGLGTVQVGAFDSEMVEDLLGVPEEATVITMTPLGYPAEEPKQTPRKELDEIVYEEKYGR